MTTANVELEKRNIIESAVHVNIFGMNLNFGKVFYAAKKSYLYAAIFVFCIPTIIISGLIQSPILSAITCLVALALVTIIDLRATLVISQAIFGLAGTLFSLVLIESGGYISEQSRSGYYIGATQTFALYALAFIVISHLSVHALGVRLTTIDIKDVLPRMRLFVIWSVVVISIFYSFAFFSIGIGVVTPLGRFGWASQLDPGLSKVHFFIAIFLLPALFALVGIHFIITRKLNYWYAFLLLPVIALWLTGEKFSGFASALFAALAGAGIGLYISKRHLRFHKKFVLLSILVLSGFLLSVVVGYLMQNSNNAFLSIFERVTLQGHVWFGIFDRFQGEAAVSFFDLVKPNSLISPSGLDLLSYIVSDDVFVRERIKLGVSFTMGGPPSALAAFGLFPGLYIYGMLGLCYAGVMLLIHSSLKRKAVLRALSSLFLFSIIAQTVLMGRWSVSYGTVAMVAYISALTLLIPRGALSARQFRDFVTSNREK